MEEGKCVHYFGGLNFLKDYTILKSSDTQGKVVNFDQICTSHNHLIVCLQFSLRLHIFIFHNLHQILAHIVGLPPSPVIDLDVLKNNQSLIVGQLQLQSAKEEEIKSTLRKQRKRVSTATE